MYTKIYKRLLDIIFALIILPFIILITLVIAPIIYFQDKGNILYVANRLGKNKRIFKMYKFRTMKCNSPDLRNEDGSTYNGENDPRVTKIGALLRKTSLDELPQIINVLKGDMSFIGPRPDLPEQIKYYNKGEEKRLNVLPGITGYNQAYYRNSIPWKQRIKNDIYYVDNISLIFDIKILFKTIDMVLGKKAVFINLEEGDIENALHK